LQLGVMGLLVCAPALGWAQDESANTASGRVGVYVDDDATTVITSVVDVGAALGDRVDAGAHALVDRVSSASVDVVSAATGRWREDRLEAGVRAALRALGFSWDAGWVHSWENDWRSQGLSLALRRELAQRNTTVQLSYGLTDNHIGRAHDPTFEEQLTTHTGEVSLTQLWDPRTWVAVIYTFQRQQGYQSSPYRYVSALDGSTQAERHPERRARHAVTLRLVRAIGAHAGWDTSYRVYTDTWGLRSHTLSTALRWQLGDAWDLDLSLRGYLQGDARFYRETYAVSARYMSADRELSRFWDVGRGGRLAWSAGAWRVSASVEGVYYRFINFARLPGRAALVTNAGATWSF